MKPPISQSDPEDRLWLAVVGLLASGLALWMDLSPIHRYHNGDSVIPILVSLQRWTPFFWEQNRFGMLLPLLALPFRNPFHNLYFQVWLRLLALVLSFFLLARVAVPRRYWPAVGGAACALLIATKSVPHLNYLHEQPYFQAIALALSGVLLLDGGGWPRRIGGSLLVALAFWVSPATLFWLVPLLALRHVLGLAGDGGGGRLGRAVFVVLLTAGCFLASTAASWLYARHAHGWTTMRPARMSDWPLGWRRLAEEALHYLSPGLVMTIGLLLAAAAFLSLAGRSWGRLAFVSGLCLLGAAAGELAALGTSRWIHSQLFDVRYLASGLTAAAVAGPALVGILLLERAPAGWQRAANALVLAGLIAVTGLRFGIPSPARARQALDAGLGRYSEVIIESGSTHVIGNFWRVWPAVLHSNLLLFERGDGRQVWGVSYRSAPTRSLWTPADWHQARFAAFGSEDEVESFRRHYGIPPLYRKATVRGVELATATPPGIPAPRIAFPPAMETKEPLGLAFHPVPPCRLLDTLWSEPLVSGAPPQRIEVAGADCGIPRGARAIAVDVRAVLPPSDGWITLWAADRPQPGLSTLTFQAGNHIVSSARVLTLSTEPRGALAMVASMADGGDVRVFLDVTGYYR